MNFAYRIPPCPGLVKGQFSWYNFCGKPGERYGVSVPAVGAVDWEAVDVGIRKP